MEGREIKKISATTRFIPFAKTNSFLSYPFYIEVNLDSGNWQLRKKVDSISLFYYYITTTIGNGMIGILSLVSKNFIRLMKL